MRFEELLKLVIEKSGKTEEEILEAVDKKISELNGLITKEGAIYLVAKSLGIDLPKKKRKLKIANLIPGVRHVTFTGRVFYISPVIEFKTKNGNKGKVVNLYVGDETGFVRIPLWNDQVEWVEEGGVRVGDVIKVRNGIARENIFGFVEVHLGKFGSIKLMQEEEGLPSVDDLISKYPFVVNEYLEKKISEIVNPGNYQIRATIVKVLKSEFVYENENGKFFIIPVMLDDGFGVIRAVFFNDVASQVTGMRIKDIENLENSEKIRVIEEKLLGRELVIKGKVKRNDEFERLEMVVNYAKNLNPVEETKKLLEEFEYGIREEERA